MVAPSIISASSIVVMSVGACAKLVREDYWEEGGWTMGFQESHDGCTGKSKAMRGTT
jgi:hypothetical protein